VSPLAGTATTVPHNHAAPTLSKKQQQRASNINKVKSNNLNIIGVNATGSSEAVDKQNWIQNYVNSSPTGLSQQQQQQPQSNEENSILTNSSLLVSSSSTSSTSTTNAPVVLLSSSATSSSSTSTNTTATIAVGLTGNEVRIKEEKEEDDNDINNNSNQEITSVTPEPLNESIEDTSLVEKFDDESINNVKSFTESLEFVS